MTTSRPLFTRRGRTRCWRLAAAPVSLALVALALSGCGDSDSGGDDDSHLVINYYQGVDVSVVPYVAEQTGMFEKNGIKVKLVPTSSGPATTSALLSGDLDMITNQVPGMMQLLEQGQDVKAVTGVYSAYPFSIVTTKSVPTKNANKFPEALHNLKGKTFGVDAIGGVTYKIMRSFLRTAGMNPDKDVKFVAVGTTSQLTSSLQNGQIDAFNALPTDVTRLVDIDHKANELIDFSKHGPKEFKPWQLSAYFTKTDRLEERPKVFKSFQKAWTDTVAYMKDPANADKINPMVGKFLNLPPDQAGKLLKKILPLLDGRNSPKALDNIAQFLADSKITKKRVDGAHAIWKG